MSSVLVRRLSHVVVALLSAFVLVRMPVVPFAEEPTVCSVSIETPAALTAMPAGALQITDYTSTIGDPDDSIDDATTNSILIEYSILRL
jgi:hypothetical protein